MIIERFALEAGTFLAGIILFAPSILAVDLQHKGGSKSEAFEGDVPEDARDPHSYSNGYTQHSGPYFDSNLPPHSHSDNTLYSAVRFDRFETVMGKSKAGSSRYESDIWVGHAFDKFLLRLEGEIEEGRWQESENEALWSHAISPFWDVVTGVRYDTGAIHGRGYAAIGLRGLAPYWFETEFTFYAGDRGRLGMKGEMEYELLFTQRLILAPRLVLALERSDASRDGDGGVAHVTAGARVRYEFSRQMAPYLGIEWLAPVRSGSNPRAGSVDSKRETDFLVGLRFWF